MRALPPSGAMLRSFTTAKQNGLENLWRGFDARCGASAPASPLSVAEACAQDGTNFEKSAGDAGPLALETRGGHG